MRTLTKVDPATLEAWKAHFLAALPRIEEHAKVKFAYLQRRDPEKFEDCIQKVIELSWKQYYRLKLKGEKDPDDFISTLADFSVRQVKDGRDITGQERAKDAMSPRAQRKKGFAVVKLPDFSTLSENPLSEALADTSLADPADLAEFNLDIPQWRDRLPALKKKVLDGKVVGDTTKQLAQKTGKSEGRVSQICRELYEDLRSRDDDGQSR